MVVRNDIAARAGAGCIERGHADDEIAYARCGSALRLRAASVSVNESVLHLAIVQVHLKVNRAAHAVVENAVLASPHKRYLLPRVVVKLVVLDDIHVGSSRGALADVNAIALRVHDLAVFNEVVRASLDDPDRMRKLVADACLRCLVAVDFQVPHGSAAHWRPHRTYTDEPIARCRMG